MSKGLEFDGYWSGEAVYTCDCCHMAEERFQFDDQNIDYKGHREAMRRKGWIFTQVNGEFKDFCGEHCRNEYIKEHT